MADPTAWSFAAWGAPRISHHLVWDGLERQGRNDEGFHSWSRTMKCLVRSSKGINETGEGFMTMNEPISKALEKRGEGCLAEIGRREDVAAQDIMSAFDKHVLPPVPSDWASVPKSVRLPHPREIIFYRLFNRLFHHRSHSSLPEK